MASGRPNTAGGDTERLSAEAWAGEGGIPALLRAAQRGGHRDLLRDQQGPAETGIAALGSLPAVVLERLPPAARSTSGLRFSTATRSRGSRSPSSSSGASNAADALQAEALAQRGLAGPGHGHQRARGHLGVPHRQGRLRLHPGTSPARRGRHSAASARPTSTTASTRCTPWRARPRLCWSRCQPAQCWASCAAR